MNINIFMASLSNEKTICMHNKIYVQYKHIYLHVEMQQQKKPHTNGEAK